MSSFEEFLNSQIIIIGGSSSGKTTTIKNIIYDLAPRMNYIFLITCNECSIKDYIGIIPWQYEDPEGRILKLIRHFRVDEDKDIIRNSVQEVIDYADKQSKIYDCIWSETEIKRINALIKKTLGITADVTVDYQKIKDLLHQWPQTKTIKDILKYIKYINFTPYSMIIFDDIISIAKALEPKIANLFIEGRHYNITTIVSSQKYMGICNTAWFNAFFRIFTQETPFC
jgi:GTPase SAR1 family protein